MSMADARAADRAGELEIAAVRYEEVLAAGVPSVEILLNLALLYWLTTDPGLSAAKGIGSDFLAMAEHRARELLVEAGLLYPGCTAVQFWKRYMAWADYGETFDIEESKRLLRDDPAVLAPAMHIFAVSQGCEMEREARQLLRQCREDGTTGSRYVVAVIEGVLKRAGHHG